MLLDAEPEGRKTHPGDPHSKPIIEGKNISVTFTKPSGLFSKSETDVKAVINASIRLQAGQTLGVVGESGSGKSTLGRALLRLLPCEGEIFFKGNEITHFDSGELKGLRDQMQLVFQDPFGSLSPRMTIGGVIGEGLLIHQPELAANDREQEVISIMQEVGLDPGMRNRYPHEFSGGQRQRIAIARSMILDPELVVLDEPTSALDRTIQKQIIELLRKLQSKHNLTYIFISHDLAVVRALSDEVIVMKRGEIVESGSVEQIFENPGQAYTQKLISAAFD
jgi:oligopeptide transport system ATP-binding protein